MENSTDLARIQEEIHSQKHVYQDARIELKTAGGKDETLLSAMVKAASDLHDLRQMRNRARNVIGVNRKGEPITPAAEKYYAERDQRRNQEEVLQEVLNEIRN